MAYTWKKLLTDPGEGNAFDIPTTGTVGGLASGAFVSRSQGGMNADVSSLSGLMQTDGSAFSAIATGSSGDVLAHTANGLEFIDAAASHQHTEYIQNTGDQTIDGSLLIHGNFECENFTAASYSFTSSTNTAYVLNAGSAIATNQEYGWQIDNDDTNDWNFFWKTDASSVDNPGELLIGRDGVEDNVAVISKGNATPTDATSGYIGEMTIDLNGDMYLCTNTSS